MLIYIYFLVTSISLSDLPSLQKYIHRGSENLVTMGHYFPSLQMTMTVLRDAQGIYLFAINIILPDCVLQEEQS